MEDFIKSLGIDKDGELTKNMYIIKADSLLELSGWYNILTDSEDVDENEDESKVSADFVNIHFDGDKYNITLYGDMENDEYRLMVEKGE